MTTRQASCSCGQLRATVEGEPVRISMCHCLACQRRTGSAFAIQARWPEDQVRIEGRHTDYVRPPTVSVWEARRHPWVVVPGSVDQHFD